MQVVVQARHGDAGTRGELHLVDAVVLHRGGEDGGEEVGAVRGGHGGEGAGRENYFIGMEYSKTRINHIRMESMKISLVSFLCGGLLGTAAAGAVLPTSTQQVEFTGSEVLALLGVPAWKTDLSLPRMAKAIQATVVIGNRTPAGVLSETEVRPPVGFQPTAPFNRATVGLVALKSEHIFSVILMNMSMAVEMPAGNSYECSTTIPRGRLIGDTLIFAYEPRSGGRGSGKDDMARFLGLKLLITE